MTHQKPEKPFITLIIITPGEDVEDEFNINRRIRVVKRRAMEGIPPNTDPSLFVLEYNDQPLDEEKKIKLYIDEFGWENRTMLELVPRPEVICVHR